MAIPAVGESRNIQGAFCGRSEWGFDATLQKFRCQCPCKRKLRTTNASSSRQASQEAQATAGASGVPCSAL